MMTQFYVAMWHLWATIIYYFLNCISGINKEYQLNDIQQHRRPPKTNKQTNKQINKQKKHHSVFNMN